MSSRAGYYRAAFRIAFRFFWVFFVLACLSTWVRGEFEPGSPPLSWWTVKFAFLFSLATASLLMLGFAVADRITLINDRKFYRRHLAKYTEEERQHVYRTQLRHLGLHDDEDDDR